MFEYNVSKAAVAAVDGNLANTTGAEHACLQEIYSPGRTAINGTSTTARDGLRSEFAWNQPIDTSFKLQEASHDSDGSTKAAWTRDQAVDDLAKIVGSTLEQRDKTV